MFSASLHVPASFLMSSSVCPLKQRKESETQCQTDCKFDLEVVEPTEPVAVETRSSKYVSRYVVRTLLLAQNVVPRVF